MDSLALNPSSPANAPGGNPERLQAALPFEPAARHDAEGRQVGEADTDHPDTDDTDAEFDWLMEDSVVVESQPAIAVYRNKRRHVVIRAEAVGYDAEDQFMFIGTETALKTLIAALQRELKLGGLRP